MFTADIIKGILWKRVPGARHGYVTCPEDNLLPGVCMGIFQQDLLKGAGKELRTKFRAVHSSSALAVNSFAPWKADPSKLLFCGHTGFQTLSFEQPCPTGLKGTPPTLDVFLASPDVAIGVESKFLEPLAPTVPKFSPSYAGIHIQDAWRELVTVYSDGVARHLDAAQLIKHGLGLLSIPGTCKKLLLYLYWTPEVPVSEEYRRHAAEIDEFRQHLSGLAGRTQLSFASMTYAELWTSWERHENLRGHIANLRKRYSASLPFECKQYKPRLPASGRTTPSASPPPPP